MEAATELWELKALVQLSLKQESIIGLVGMSVHLYENVDRGTVGRKMSVLGTFPTSFKYVSDAYKYRRKRRENLKNIFEHHLFVVHQRLGVEPGDQYSVP